LTIETIGTKTAITEQQAYSFALSMYASIQRYCDAHLKEFEAWAAEQQECASGALV
jgi:hypothetical protein